MKAPLFLVGLAVLASCCGRGDGGEPDASADEGAVPDACSQACALDDSGADAGDGGIPEVPRASGGCSELTTTELSSAPGNVYTWRRISGASGRFFSTLIEHLDRDTAQCLFFTHDGGGSLLNRTEVAVDSGLCGPDGISDDGDVLQVRDNEVWVGRLDGSGEWVPQEASSGMPTNLGREGVLLSDWQGRLSRYGWQGQLAASYDLKVVPSIEANPEAASVGWSGTVLAVAYRLGADDLFERYTDRVYFQRFDADLVPIDPEPILVLELRPYARPAEYLDDRSPLRVGWDGSEFGVVVTWVEDFIDLVDTHTDVFLFGENGDVRGSFSVDQPSLPAPAGYEGYVADQLLEVWSVPEAGRLVISSVADYWVPDGGLSDSIEWTGVHFVPIDLETGERAGDDARLWVDWFSADMARLGGRVGILWEHRENLNEDHTQFIRHLMFTVLDCSETFGVP